MAKPNFVFVLSCAVFRKIFLVRKHVPCCAFEAEVVRELTLDSKEVGELPYILFGVAATTDNEELCDISSHLPFSFR